MLFKSEAFIKTFLTLIIPEIINSNICAVHNISLFACRQLTEELKRKKIGFVGTHWTLAILSIV